jgi:hypothetical protein
MLTDDEIIKIAADTKTGEPGLHGYILPISFAREIERAVLAKAGEQKAIDENANDRGEPDAIYLQLHDPESLDDTEKDDFRADGVTWCWHSINENDVRYIRADLAHQTPAQAIPQKIGINMAVSGSYRSGWNDCIDAMLSASPKPE